MDYNASGRGPIEALSWNFTGRTRKTAKKPAGKPM